MMRKRQLHDGIGGALITAGVALGDYVGVLNNEDFHVQICPE
jgi:hypothetical protein